jgi:uncharacterized membrane protein YfcA
MVTFPISGVETYWWLPALVAFVVSFFTSMGGLSGAFILMPFQVSILGFNTPSVSPTNLVYNIFAIPGGVHRFIREKRLVMPLAITIILGTTPGLIIGAYLRIKYLADPKNFKLFVGLVLLYIVFRLIKEILAKEKALNKFSDFSVRILEFNAKVIRFEFKEQVYKISAWILFSLTLVVGVIGGAYGIGGGAIISPFLIAVFGLPVYAVAGAALLGTFFTSIAGVLIYSYLVNFIFPGQAIANPDWLLGFSMGVGGFIGIYLGARCQRYFPARFIKAVLAVSIAVVVVKYVGGYFW